MKEFLQRVLPGSAREPIRATKLWFMRNFMSKVAQAILRHLDGKDLQRALRNIGYSVARTDDYYSPLPTVTELEKSRSRWDRPSALLGLTFDLEKMKAHLEDLLQRYGEEFAAYPSYRELSRIGFGPGYTAVDALTLYTMIRQLKPRRYIEVGSGLSTYYASLAAAKNASDGSPVRITCIEPNPYEKLYSIPGIEIIKDAVQNVDPSLFQTLQQDDILFIDSSHVLKVGGDVPFLSLEILPSLNAGVTIHVHDVPFPYNVPFPSNLWVFGQKWPLLWNEAMVLQAFLCGNKDFEIVLSTPLIRYFDEAFLRQKVPIYESIEENPNAFSSLWLRRTAMSYPSVQQFPQGDRSEDPAFPYSPLAEKRYA